MNSLPYEVVGPPLTIWLAEVGTAFPDLDTPDASIDAAWVKVGTNGNKSYDASGVILEMPQSLNPWRSLGSAGPAKMFREEEDCIITAMIADLTLENLKHGLNSNSITDTPEGVGSVGHRSIGLSRGLTVSTLALLLRATGYSPYMANGIIQYEIPRAANISSMRLEHTRTGPVTWEFKAQCLVDPNAANDQEVFGRARYQDAEALT